MNFFGCDNDEDCTVARYKVSDWLQTKDSELKNTSIAKLSRMAAAELDIPLGTVSRALYKLRDTGELVRSGGTRSNGDFVVVVKEAKRRSYHKHNTDNLIGQKQSQKDANNTNKNITPKTTVVTSKDGKNINISITLNIGV